MTKEEALKKAEAWGKKQEWPYDVVRYVGKEVDSYLFHLDHSRRPKYAGFGVVLRISINSLFVIKNFVEISNILDNADDF